ncbi:MAG: heme-binding beta-barrel domain-containing protein [Actinomycetaceae bacterium]|nr:heme-binding beta-barrel domain-containing protein [Actinomycetaceae bacterium]
MIVIPENLPKRVAPLTWLLGTWRGWGTATGDDGDVLISFEFDAQVVGTRVRSQLTVYSTDSAVELDAQTGALDGADALNKSGVAWEETAYWSVVSDPENEDDKYLQVTSATTRGLALLWVGKVQGPRIRLLVDTLARTEDALAVSKGDRMLGLVNSDIFFTETMTTPKGNLTASGRVARVQDPQPIPPFAKEGM